MGDAGEDAGAAAPDLDRSAGEVDGMLAATSDGVALYDAAGRLIRVNAALRSLLALDLLPDYARAPLDARLSRLRLRDRHGNPMPAERWPHVRALQGQVLTGGDAVETLVTALDGRELLLTTSAAPVRDREGRVIGAVCITRDATERWRLERDLALRARQIDALFDAIPDGLGFFDAQGTVLRFNRAARSLFGADRREALADLPDAYAVRTLSGEPFPREELPLASALRGEPVEASEMLVRTADGTDQVISARAAPWHDPNGAIEGVVVVVHDITALHEANQRMDELLAVASHELKSPLTGIRGTVQLLQRRLKRILDRDDMSLAQVAAALAPLTDMLQRAERQVERQTRMINDLLDISRIQAGRLDLHPEVFDLRTLARESVDESGMAWPARTVTLDAPEAELPVRADADRLRQVLTNYMRPGHNSSERPPERPE